MIKYPSRLTQVQFGITKDAIKDNVSVSNKIELRNQYATIYTGFPQRIDIKMPFIGTMNIKGAYINIIIRVLAPLYYPGKNYLKISYIDILGTETIINPIYNLPGLITFELIPVNGVSSNTFKIIIK